MRLFRKLHLIFRIAILLVLAALLLWAGLMGMVWWKENHIPQLERYDALVVLGAQVKEDGSMSVQLQWRVDAALEAWRKQPCIIVCCGGQGTNEPAAEGAVMRDYLIAQGVPPEQVLADTASTTTLQNLRYAKALLREQGLTGGVCVVTSDYHLPRALALAGDVGLQATGIGSATKPEYWLKNHSREALAWVKYWGQKLLGRTGG